LRLPLRNINAEELIKFLKTYGYEITRQIGSHIRFSSNFKGYQHNLIIPNHKPIKIGTLNNILNDVARYLEIDKAEIVELFDKHK
jgi:predicted RNA binding protein YcfA (HicA-like mRNA interferase family)